jgi:hypothetical protein
MSVSLPPAFLRAGKDILTAAGSRPRIIAGLGLVLALGLAIGGLVVRSQAIGRFGDDPAPPDVERIVSVVFSRDVCTSAEIAEATLRATLTSVAGEWAVIRSSGVKSDTCVAAGIDSVGHRIVLIAALNPATREALAAFGERLRRDCLTEDEATDALRRTLAELGEAEWELRTEGAVSGPADQIDEVERHVEAGCWIYNGTGWTAEGTRLYFLGGR